MISLRDFDRRRDVPLLSIGGAQLLATRLPGVWYRLLMALGIWDVCEGGYYRNGRLTWENRHSKMYPDFASNGNAFWSFVLNAGFPFD